MEQKEKISFMDWIEVYDGAHTYCKDVSSWIRVDKKLQNLPNKNWLIANMKLDDYFEPRHFRKVEVAYSHYLEEVGGD